MIFGLAFAAPYSVLNTDSVFASTPKSSFACVTGHKALLLKVVFADSPAAKFANRPCFLFTLDAFHNLNTPDVFDHPSMPEGSSSSYVDIGDWTMMAFIQARSR